MLLASPLSHAAAQDTGGRTPGETLAASLYDFKLGEWTMTARSMRPDRTFNEGTGDLSVYRVHDGQTIQADMRVRFEDGTGFVGSTMRTLIADEGIWIVTWVPAGARVTPSGTGIGDGNRVVETFTGSDQFGSYTDALILSEISDSYFAVQMDRQYDDGGPFVPGVWQYEATRSR